MSTTIDAIVKHNAAALTDAQLARMIETVPASSVDSPMHLALIAERDERAGAQR